MTNDEIAARIRHLEAVTVARGATEGEASNARAVADRLRDTLTRRNAGLRQGSAVPPPWLQEMAQGAPRDSRADVVPAIRDLSTDTKRNGRWAAFLGWLRLTAQNKVSWRG